MWVKPRTALGSRLIAKSACMPSAVIAGGSYGAPYQGPQCRKSSQVRATCEMRAARTLVLQTPLMPPLQAVRFR